MTRVNLEGSSDKAARMLRIMANPKHIALDKAVPAQLIRQAHGIAFVSVFKTGMSMLGSATAGGCVIAKVRDDRYSTQQPSDDRTRWSAPSCITCSGLGGVLLGGELIDCMIILNTKKALGAFLEGKTVVLGDDVSLASGPIGEDAEAHLNYSDNSKFVAAFSYCLSSKGRGAAQHSNPTLDIHGTTLGTRLDENIRFYGRNVTAEHILTGQTQVPIFAKALLNELHMLTQLEGDYETLPVFPVSRGEYANSGREILLRGLRYAGAAVAGRELPSGWEKAVASEGNVYYFNRTTGVTQWELPEMMAVQQIAAREKEDDEEEGDVDDDEYEDEDSEEEEGVDPNEGVYTALYSYISQQQDELSFKQGDQVTILDASDPNWWKAQLDGLSGVVPSNYF